MKITETPALELLHPKHRPDGKIRAAIFDFDGTFSTLRCGWEQVMRPLMLEVLSGGSADAAPAELQREVDEYIDASTGIQTVYQMRWLAQRAQQAGHGVAGRAHRAACRCACRSRGREARRDRVCRSDPSDTAP